MMKQEEHLKRVTGKIAPAVLDFVRERLRRDGTFFVEELQEYVKRKALVAPASPDRVLRNLRQQGKLDYVIESRRNALYRVLWVSA